MSRLAKYLEKNRITASRALMERWEFDARYNGDVNIKKQVASAKRTATTLKNAMGQFSNLTPEQELAIRAAASAMQSLADELASIVKWSKAYKDFCGAESKREDEEELERLSMERWGTDEAAVQFEADLVQELGTKDGSLAFAQWLHSINLHTDVPENGISSCIDRLGHGETLRQQLAYRIREERRATNNQWRTREGERLIASFSTYERYLAHRKEVAVKAADILSSFT